MSERGNAKLKFIDRWIGPLLLGLLKPLKLFRGARDLSAGWQDVAIVKPAAIGDTVLLSAIVSDLKAANPACRITLFAGDSNYEFAKSIEGVNNVVRLTLSKPWIALKQVRSQVYDLILDTDSWPRISALLAGLSRAHLKVGFKTPNQFRHYLFDRVIEHSPNQHEIENYRSLLNSIGISAKSPPQVFQSEWKNGSNEVIFHFWPGGTKSYLKEWKSDCWIELANRLMKLGDFKFVLTGGRADIDRTANFIQTLQPELRPRFINRAGVPFSETLSILRSSRLVVSVNTGLMHVAASIGAPTVGLHGPTSPHRWGPIGKRTRSVLSKSEGAGCLNLGFEYLDDVNLMNGIDIDDVVDACTELLN